MRCLMGDDGVLAVDHLAQKFWTRDALDDELAHDADLDVDSLFVTHMVYENESGESDEQPAPYWAHTHGLAELGALDFDILRPAPLLCGTGYDVFRAIAFCILEGEITATTSRVQVISPGGAVAFVSIGEFNRRAAPADVALRGDREDPAHNQLRLIACEPRRGGMLGWLLDRRVRPSRLLSTVDDERMVTHFPRSASLLMAQRARKTFGVFCRLIEELREFHVAPLVKLGLRVDGGGPEDREHMWFEVSGYSGNSVEGTLLNEPYHVAGMKAGDRGSYDLETLTDWTIMTPCGSITPRHMHAARFLRANRSEILKELARSSADNVQ
jgi:uncharacterized protein YegJ (DUF2314 family)